MGSRPFSGQLIDRSRLGEFRFAAVCPICSFQWRSKPIPFSRRNVPAPTPGKQKIYGLLWQREYIQAREKAIQEGQQRFNRCPMCGRWVCDQCFRICDEIDLCAACSSELGEKGVRVAAERELNDENEEEPIWQRIFWVDWAVS